MAKNGQDKLTVKFPTFFGPRHILVAGAGPRGPAHIGLWTYHNQDKNGPVKDFEATVDAKPISAMAMNNDSTLLACGFTTGNKAVFKVDLGGFAKGGMPVFFLLFC